MDDYPRQLLMGSGQVVALSSEQAWSLHGSRVIEWEPGGQTARCLAPDGVVRSMLGQLAGGAMCDFCAQSLTAEESIWSYPARDFSVSPDASSQINSAGGWAACAGCHRLIQGYDRKGLVRRAVRMFMAKEQQTLPREQRRMLEAQLNRLHQRFWKHRTGSPSQVR